MSVAASLPRGRQRIARGASGRSLIRFQPLLVFVAAHPILALALQRSSALSTLHALSSLALGLVFALRDRSAERVVYVAGYIAAVELLWRGTGASVFWEFGKYATAVLLMVALLRFGKLVRSQKLPLLFFLLLLPSIAVLPYFDRTEVAFNLTGPFSLAVATMFFSAVKFEADHLRNMALIMLAPILGIAGLSAVSSFQTDLTIMYAGSKATTAGIGPNQVSSLLGLGIVLGVLLLFTERERKWLRWALLLALVWLTSQCLLSFSRGGLWAALGALLVAAMYLLRSQRARGILVASAAVLFLLLNFLVIPLLNGLTAGRLERRYLDTSPTGRDRIIRADLIAFRENPLLGVGPGQSKEWHSLTFRRSSAHTEYSRMLAEHGSLGLLALVLLGAMVARRGLSRASPMAKAVALSLTAWAMLTMAHSAMRLASVGFVFGLGAAIFAIEAAAARPAPGVAFSRRAVAPVAVAAGGD